MKKSAICFFLTMLLASGLGLAKTPNFYFTLGIGKPMSPTDMKTNYLSGAHVGLMAGLPVAKRMEMVADFGFQMAIFDVRDFRSTLPVSNEGKDYVIKGNNAVFFTGMLKTKFIMSSDNDGKHVAYLFAGPGFVYSKTGSIQWLIDDENLSDGQIASASKTSLGATFGLGVELKMEATIFMAELGAILGFSDESTLVLTPIRLGLALKP